MSVVGQPLYCASPEAWRQYEDCLTNFKVKGFERRLDPQETELDIKFLQLLRFRSLLKRVKW